MDTAAESFARSKTRSAHISPAASDEEAAAIAVAVEALWPRPVVATDGADRRPAVWKFSGRWWSQPIPLRRARPWV